jgi:PAS domain S-box-containing protein
MTVHDEACAQAGRAQDPWRAIYEASPVPTAITRRADDRILFVNRSCLQMLGWTQAAVAGRTMVDVGFWVASEQRTRMLEQLDAGQPVHELEQTVTTALARRLSC